MNWYRGASDNNHNRLDDINEYVIHLQEEIVDEFHQRLLQGEDKLDIISSITEKSSQKLGIKQDEFFYRTQVWSMIADSVRDFFNED